ncbi:MAG: replication initiator protein A [Paracoccaceae bacterium]|nr:replication initiator protein A [Paracoccaceae bacterium]
MPELEKKERSPLLPVRHPQRDFFVCDIFDAAPKSDMASMEHPLFTLSTKPDMMPRRYEMNDNWIELRPSSIGLATVFDRDILIYCISQCMAALNEGRQIHRTMRLSAHDVLKATNRDTSDKGYAGFKAALTRLRSTEIQTNITTGGVEQWEVFGFIDAAKTIRKSRQGRMLAVEITLSDWLFNALDAKRGEILTISPQYFQLRKPLERRLYEIARKSCGTKNRMLRYGMEKLRMKTGSQSTPKEFRRMVKAIVDMNNEKSHIPDYSFELDGDLFIIRPRADFTDIYAEPEMADAIDQITLPSSAYDNARKHVGGYDLYFLEREWRGMLSGKNSVPDNPSGSFINFVKSYVSRNGEARLLI